MKKTFIAGAILLAIIAGGVTTASAETVATTMSTDQMSVLMKQIEMLQSQIAELKKANIVLQSDVTLLREEMKIARTLRQGDKGDDVKMLQEMLGTDSAIFSGGTTGYYGPKTAEAIRRLQEKMGLEKVGHVGPKTLEKINKILSEGAGNSGKIPPGMLKEHGRGMMVALKPVGESGVKGFAGLSFTMKTSVTTTGSSTGIVKVKIELWEKGVMHDRPEHMPAASTTTTTPVAMAHPAHIHSGSCAAQGPVKWPLTPVINGRSETTIELPLKDLVAAMPLYINVHKSAAEIATSIACGDIKKPSSVWKGHEMDEDEDEDDDRDDMKGHMNSEKPKSDTTHNDMAGVTKKFELVAANFSYSLKEIKVKKGDKVGINLKVSDGFHDLVIDEMKARTAKVSAGQITSVVFTADKVGTFEYYCSVGDHRAQGMVGKIVVEE